MEMKYKPYSIGESSSPKLAEPVASYQVTERVSLQNIGISSTHFNAMVERSEDDFVTGNYITTNNLIQKIKQQRGW